MGQLVEFEDLPLPVTLDGEINRVITTRLINVGPIMIPGITAADALDAADAFGTIFPVTVPKSGAILRAIFHDLDDEGTDHVLHIFGSRPATQPASDAVLDYTDLDNLLYRGRIRFLTATVAEQDLTSNQIGFGHTSDLPFYFAAGDQRLLWMQAQVVGTDSIAAGQMPEVSFVVQVFEE